MHLHIIWCYTGCQKSHTHCGHVPLSRATPPLRTPRTPTLWCTMNVLPRAASSHSAKGVVAASLDHCGNEEEDGPLHQFHICRVQLVSSGKELEAPPHQVVQSFPTKDGQIDTLLRATKWLKNCKGEYEDNTLIWSPLIHPLTDGSNATTLGLTRKLLATWRWAVTVYKPPTCPPTPTVLNTGQFLDENTTGCRWGVQQWLEAYNSRGWALETSWERFCPKGVQVEEAMNDPLEDVPCQRDKGAHAKVISYLDELAMHQPLWRAWDELIWPSQSTAPHVPP